MIPLNDLLSFIAPPPPSSGLFITPANVVPPSHHSHVCDRPSTLLLSPPLANATVILLGDLAELQLAAAPIALIIVVDIIIRKLESGIP
jgi:hypothetical protein